MQDDAALLLLYVRNGSEAAFRELVQRHIAFVYQSALRQSGGNAAQAADVTQIVFTHLAQKARSLTHHPSLLSWLLKSTRYAALKAWRTERRRKKHETEAGTMDELLKDSHPAADWDNLRPVLDEALCELAEKDRQALLWRFFGGLTLAQVGAKQGLREDAARMRVDRALDRLRSVLERRGIASSTAALGLLMANQPAIAVPASLAAGVSAAALAGAGVGGSFSTAIILMNQKIVIPAVAAMLTLGVAVFQANKATGLRAELDAANQSLRKQILLAEQSARQGNQDAREIERLRAEIERLGRASAEALSANAPRATAAAQPAVGFMEGTDVSSKLQQRYPNGVVAVVGSRAILTKDVEREISPQAVNSIKASADSEQVLSDRLDQTVGAVIQNLVDRELVVQEFRKDNPEGDEIRKIAPTYTDTAIAAMERDDFGGDHAKFLAYIQSLGMSRSEYRSKVEDDIAFRYMLGQLRLPADGSAGNETPAQRRDAFLERLRSGGTVRRF